jgi:uncharacterized protein YjbI with pentapeptide repeats
MSAPEGAGDLQLSHGEVGTVIEGAGRTGRHVSERETGTCHPYESRFARCKPPQQGPGPFQLGNADLTGCHLSGADLTRADLSVAALDGATLVVRG